MIEDFHLPANYNTLGNTAKKSPESFQRHKLELAFLSHDLEVVAGGKRRGK